MTPQEAEEALAYIEWTRKASRAKTLADVRRVLAEVAGEVPCLSDEVRQVIALILERLVKLHDA